MGAKQIAYKKSKKTSADHPALYALAAIMASGFFAFTSFANMSQAAVVYPPQAVYTKTMPGVVAPTPLTAADLNKALSSMENDLDIKLACNRKYMACIMNNAVTSEGRDTTQQTTTCVWQYRACVQGNSATAGVAQAPTSPKEYDNYR